MDILWCGKLRIVWRYSSVGLIPYLLMMIPANSISCFAKLHFSVSGEKTIPLLLCYCGWWCCRLWRRPPPGCCSRRPRHQLLYQNPNCQVHRVKWSRSHQFSCYTHLQKSHTPEANSCTCTCHPLWRRWSCACPPPPAPPHGPHSPGYFWAYPHRQFLLLLFGFWCGEPLICRLYWVQRDQWSSLIFYCDDYHSAPCVRGPIGDL